MTDTTIPKGEYGLSFAPSLIAQWGGSNLSSSVGGRKRKREEEQLVGLRYAFKPASVTADTSGTYHPDAGIGGGGQVVFDGGTQQVFDVREELSKPRECVLVFDEETQSFILHALPSTLHLTLNRSSSSQNRRPASVISSASTSTSSSSISHRPSRTAARRGADQQPIEDGERDDDEGHIIGDEYNSDSRHNGLIDPADEGTENDTPRPKKKSRASELPNATPLAAYSTGTRSGAGTSNAIGRNTKGGKGLPRKKPLESAPIPVLAAPRQSAASTGAAGKGKGKTKGKAAKSKATSTGTGTGAGRGKKEATSAAAQAPSQSRIEEGGKFKSAEYIDDSDDEAGGGGDEMDEFANLLGESLAQGDDQSQTQVPVDEYDDDDDGESEDEEDEDEDALGGARLVVSSNPNVERGGAGVGASASAGQVMMANDDDTEWI